jgi:stage II sporulation protein D
MNKQDLTEMLRPVFEGALDPGVLQSLEIKTCDPSGRVRELDVRFTNAHKIISGYKLYLLWGRSTRWHQLKSTWFEISPWGNSFEFRGRGLGHGIGLCQWGAYGRAVQGFNYRDILAHYFSGTQIGNGN